MGLNTVESALMFSRAGREPHQEIPALGGLRLEPDFPGGFPEDCEADGDIRAKSIHSGALCPLHGCDAPAFQAFGYSGGFEVIRAKEAVEVGVEECQAAWILGEDGVCGACHGDAVRDMKTLGKPLDKAGFARAQVSGEGQNKPWEGQGAQGGGGPAGIRGTGGGEGEGMKGLHRLTADFG
jgi:hypothetical protein